MGLPVYSQPRCFIDLIQRVFVCVDMCLVDSPFEVRIILLRDFIQNALVGVCMSHRISTRASICNTASALPAAFACDTAFLCAYCQLRIFRCRDRNLNCGYGEKALRGIPRQLCPYIVAVCEVLHAFVDVRQIDGFRTDRA